MMHLATVIILHTLNEIVDELLDHLKDYKQKQRLSSGIAAALHATHSPQDLINQNIMDKPASKWKLYGDKEGLQ